MTNQALILEALEALSVDSLSSYAWLGQRFALQRAENGDEDGRAAAVTALAERLYADFYCTGGVAPPQVMKEPRSGLWPSPQSKALSAANRGLGCRQAGWIVRDEEDGFVVVERDGLRLWAEPSRLPDAAAAQPGEEVVLILEKEQLGLPDGFYIAFGDAGDAETSDTVPLDRFYWNIRPEGRAILVGALTSTLNGAGLPFRLKVLNDPREERCDAGVLYVSSVHRAPVVRALAEVLRAAAPHMRASVPSFTLPLAPGLAFAEDPPGEDSFGTSRCGLMADAIVGAYERGVRGLDRRFEAVADEFAAAGLSLGALHLNPGSDVGLDPVPRVG